VQTESKQKSGQRQKAKERQKERENKGSVVLNTKEEKVNLSSKARCFLQFDGGALYVGPYSRFFGRQVNNANNQVQSVRVHHHSPDFPFLHQPVGPSFDGSG
jgi:hypothetical protein